MLERGIAVSCETARHWALKFRRAYARRLKRKRPVGPSIWHLDEAFVTIADKRHWLWRAVDQQDCVLDEIRPTRRDTRAAIRLLNDFSASRAARPDA